MRLFGIIFRLGDVVRSNTIGALLSTDIFSNKYPHTTAALLTSIRFPSKHTWKVYRENNDDESIKELEVFDKIEIGSVTVNPLT